MPLSRNLDLEQYLRNQLKRYHPETKTLDLSGKTQLWYTTQEQAGRWTSLATHDFSGLEIMLLQLAGKIPPPTMVIVDYGCGDGLKGIKAHRLLHAQAQLYQIDYSAEMLKIAAENAAQAGVEANSILTNLALSPTITSEIEDGLIPLHLFLGQTIGNPLHPENLVKAITSSMRKDEYLIVEWLRTNKGHYDDPEGKNRDFVAGYLQALGLGQEYFCKDDGQADFFVETYRDEHQKEWFQSGFFLHKEFFHPQTKKTLSPGDKIIATRSRRFEEQEVLDLFEKHGLEAEMIKPVYQEIAQGILIDAGISIPVQNGNYSVNKNISWLEYGDLRYALFRKVKEKKKKSLLSVIALLTMGLGAGYYFFTNQPTVCEDAKIKNRFTIQCRVDDQEREIKFNEISNLYLSQNNDITTGTINGKNYTFEIKDKQRSSFRESFGLYQLIMEEVKRPDQCLREIVYKEEEILKMFAHCTNDVGVTLAAVEMVALYHEKKMDEYAQRIFAPIERDLFKDRNVYDVKQVLHFFSDPRVMKISSLLGPDSLDDNTWRFIEIARTGHENTLEGITAILDHYAHRSRNDNDGNKRKATTRQNVKRILHAFSQGIGVLDNSLLSRYIKLAQSQEKSETSINIIDVIGDYIQATQKKEDSRLRPHKPRLDHLQRSYFPAFFETVESFSDMEGRWAVIHAMDFIRREYTKKTILDSTTKKVYYEKNDAWAWLPDSILFGQMMKYDCLLERLITISTEMTRKTAYGPRINKEVQKNYHDFIQEVIYVARNQPFGVIGEQRITFLMKILPFGKPNESPQSIPTRHIRKNEPLGKILTTDLYHTLWDVSLDTEGPKRLIIDPQQKPLLPYETWICLD